MRSPWGRALGTAGLVGASLLLPGVVQLFTRPVRLRSAALSLLAVGGGLNLAFWLAAVPREIRTFDPIAVIAVPSLDDAFLGKLAEARQEGDAVVLVAEVGRGGIQFQRLEPILKPGQPIEPLPLFWPLFALFLTSYLTGAGVGVAQTLADRRRVGP